jgi:hypothetical protein
MNILERLVLRVANGWRRFVAVIGLTAAIGLSPLAAQEVQIAAVPTAWRVQNYVPQTVVLWFTGSTCANGQLTLPATAVKADSDRLYATVMMGKAAGKKVYVYYTANAGGCLINSFGLEAE